MLYRKFLKNNKKIKKNTIADSFQVKIGRKMMRKRENKNYRSVPFRSRCIMENSKEIAKKLKILKKNLYGVISSQNMLENDEKERK